MSVERNEAVVIDLHAPEIFVVNAGDGNPATAISIYFLVNYLKNPRLHFLNWSGKLAFIFHKMMSKSPDISQKYTKSTDNWRKKGLPLLAVLGKVERYLYGNNFTGRQAWFVQEASLASFSCEELQAYFPGGVILYVPDVYLKSSALPILRKRPLVKVAVWNKEAREELIGIGLNESRIILTPPLLPVGFYWHYLETFGPDHKLKLSDWLLIKSSGSGMPDNYLKTLMRIVFGQELSGLEPVIHLPDRTLVMKTSDYDTQPNPKGAFGRIVDFYNKFFDVIPKVLITYPSEMVQVVYWLRSLGLETNFIALPPRGEHEVRNLEWARNQGLVKAELDYNLSNWEDQIKEVISVA